MKNTDFLNLELPEREDKINVEVLTSDFKIIEDIIKQHAVVETMELDGVGAITGAIGPYIRLQNISEQQVTVDIGNETIVLESGENKIIRETAQNIGVITSGNVHITYFTNAKTYTDRNFYDKKKVDELLSKVEATVEVDAELSETSENPVQNKAITAELASYATTAEVERKVTEKVAEIVAGAPEDFDTLKEMSDWLKEHEDSAASMNSAIQKNAEDIVTANANISKNASDISASNTNIQKNVDDITAVKNDVAINRTTLGTQCKNLFKLKQNAGYTQTVSGVSYTFNGDGSITASGTLTGEAALNFSEIYLEAGTYRISSSKFFNVQIYKSGGYVCGSQATPEGKIITINEAGTYSFRWYWGGTGTVVNTTVYPMLTYADVSDVNFKPYAPNLDTRISVLETLSDVVYKNNKSSYCSIDGYILRVGNQVHLNLTATVHTACTAWVGSIIMLPFKVKTPDGSQRYTIKQTQTDEREISIYISNGSSSFFSSTALQKGDVITIQPMILDMYVEETATTEGGE